MKKLINILIVLAALMVTSNVMASEDNDDETISYRGQMLKRMQANQVRSRTRAVLMETYYGEKIETSEVRGAGRDGSIASVLREREVRLNSGRVYRTEEIEYVYTNESARAPHERVRGQVERLPEDDSE